MPSDEIPGGIPDSGWKPVAFRAEERGEGQFLTVIREKMPVFVKELIAGGVAGGLAKTAVAPLERVKILLQTRREDFLSLGVWGTALKIVRTEGVLGLYKGNGASVARIVPYAALHFMAYEQYRRWILEFFPNTNRGPVLDLIAGSLAGGTAVLCTYPLDLVRTTLAYQVSGPSTTRVLNRVGSSSIEPVYRGIIGTILKIYKDGGVRGLYRGVAPTLYGIFPYAGLKFYFYEEMKSRVPKEHRKNVAVKLGCGAIAGLLGQTITYPLDVVRRQMQVELLSQPPTIVRVDKGTLESLIKIIQEQGWRQLFSGLSINYIKVAPSVAIGFTVYDGMKSWLRVPPREEVSAPIVLEGRERETSSLHS